MNQPEILFVNNDFLIINKPAGWLSIPGRTPVPTDRVISEWVAKELKIEESDTTPFIVHRLDRYTSGIMLFAKNKDAHQTANAWFQKREVKKVYHFFATPDPHPPRYSNKNTH